MAGVDHGHRRRPPVPGLQAELEAQTATSSNGTTLRLIHGEELHYTGDFGVFGEVGSGLMSVSAPHCEQRRAVVRLDFSFRGRIMLMGIRDETSSWLDASERFSLRYEKDERHPMGTRTERVVIYPDQGWWEPEGGVVQALDSPHPLDELSFLFLARSLDLELGESVEVARHFDPERNPVVMRDLGRSVVTVPAGRFDVRLVQMDVHDPTRFGDAGRVVLYLTDDADRIPVKIATAMPVVGEMVLVLERRTVDRQAASTRIPVC
jgi:hypothetical protein